MSCRIYQSPGRLRVRLSPLRTGIPEGLVDELKSLQGVRSVLPSPVSGSIVVYYDKDIRCSSSILRVFQRHGLLENVVGFPSRSALAIIPRDKPTSLVERINEFLKKTLISEIVR